MNTKRQRYPRCLFSKPDKLMFNALLHRTIKYVIPKKGEALTWESPALQFKFVQPN